MGMIAMIFVCIATLGVTWLVWFWERREWRSQIRSETEDKERSVTHEQGAPEGSA